MQHAHAGALELLEYCYSENWALRKQKLAGEAHFASVSKASVASRAHFVIWNPSNKNLLESRRLIFLTESCSLA